MWLSRLSPKSRRVAHRNPAVESSVSGCLDGDATWWDLLLSFGVQVVKICPVVGAGGLLLGALAPTGRHHFTQGASGSSSQSHWISSAGGWSISMVARPFTPEHA